MGSLVSKLQLINCLQICQRDGILCLIFRIRDEYKRYELHTKVNAYLVINRIGGPSLKKIVIEKPGPLIWPIEIIHKITPSSPFWDLSAKDLLLKRLLSIIILTKNILKILTLDLS